MKFYYYSQNNSGGSFDKEMGYALIIEAENANQANDKAEELGVYFNGCADGIDCPCCGDRWDSCSDYEGKDQPTMYGEKHDPNGVEVYYWQMPVIIYYADGKIENFKK